MSLHETTVDNERYIGWKKFEGATHYDVYIGTTTDSKTKVLRTNRELVKVADLYAILPVSHMVISVTPVQNGEQFTTEISPGVVVRLDSNELAIEITAPPPAPPPPITKPANFRMDTSSFVYTFRWDGVPDASGYRIYASDIAGGPYVQIANTQQTSHALQDVNRRPPNPNMLIYCVVRSVNGAGVESESSNEIVLRFVNGVLVP